MVVRKLEELKYGYMFYSGEDLFQNKSLAVHHYKLSADQDVAEVQLNYGFMTYSSENVL
jgi:TPR repeat protein